MSEPRHHGPACAGQCEGQAYQIEIRRLKKRIEALETERIPETVRETMDSETKRCKVCKSTWKIYDDEMR